MKKLLLVSLLLISCARNPVNLISWNGLSFPESEVWTFSSAEVNTLTVTGGVGGVTIEIIDNTDSYTDFEEINIADQNYKLISKTEPVVITTNWQSNDLLITGSKVNFEMLSGLLSTFKNSTMTWEGYEFKRPKTLDWYMKDNTINFVKDDGDNLEKEVAEPFNPTSEMKVSIISDATKLNTASTGEVKFYKEIDFDGSIYEVLRTVEDGVEYVTYKGKISDSKFVLIRALKTHDGAAQNILNKVIGI